MAFESTIGAVGFLGARVLFGVVLGYLALGNLLDYEQTVVYARSKGAPFPEVTVPAGSLLLVAGAASIMLGIYPLLGAIAVAAFLVAITPVMHDFWALDGQEAQNEQVHFLKNVGLLGAALVFLALASVEWPYAIGVGL